MTSPDPGGTENPRPHILVIEDNQLNRDLLLDVLLIHGYEVEGVRSVAEAEAAMARRLPDLIVTDIHLGRENGLDLLRGLKTQPAATRPLAIVVSASALRGERDQAMAAGAALYLAKPIDVREFPHQVARLLATRKGGAAGATPQSP
ncbi:MAG: response regulator [Planctomycetes bacterium]|nr:response regulator [Planctomycetota bacterium]